MDAPTAPPLSNLAVTVYALAFIAFWFVAWRRPAFSLIGYFVVIPFDFAHTALHATVTLSKVALLAILLGLLCKRATLDVFGDPRLRAVLLSASAIAVTAAVSVLQANFKIPAIHETAKAVEYVLAITMVAWCYVCDPDERSVWFALFGIAAAVSVCALAQEFTGASETILFGHRVVPRIAGPLDGPNQLAGYLGLLVPLMVAYLLSAPRAVFGWIAVAVSTAALMLTFSRAGFVCGLLAVSVTFVAAPRRNTRTALVLAAGVIAGIIAIFFAGGQLSRFWSVRSSDQVMALGTRHQLWIAAYRLWRAHPFLGIGAGNYEPELGWAGFPELHTHANSGYIQALTEGGIPGLAALLWFRWLSITTFVRSRIRTPLIVGALGACVGFAAHEFLDYLMFYPKDALMMCTALGLGVAALAVSEPAWKGKEAHAAAN